MTRARTAPARLALVGALTGGGAAVGALLVLRLLALDQVTGLSALADLALAVPGGPRSALVREIGTVTWVGLPAGVVYLVAPITLLTTGVVAGRLTYSSRARVGLRAGLTIALGFAPPMLLLGAWAGYASSPESLPSLLVISLLYPLFFGALGGIVGVKT